MAAGAAQGAGINGEDKGAADEDVAPSDPWVPLRVRLLHGEAELVTTERMPSTGGGSSSSSAGAGVGGFGSSAADMPADAVARAAAAKELDLAELAGAVLSALAEWEALARDSATYANVDVACAGLRVQNGLPALRRDPAALLDGVKLDLGPRPDARAQPTAFALWVAALLNPLPALGVAPELRASVLSRERGAAPPRRSELAGQAASRLHLRVGPANSEPQKVFWNPPASVVRSLFPSASAVARKIPTVVTSPQSTSSSSILFPLLVRLGALEP